MAVNEASRRGTDAERAPVSPVREVLPALPAALEALVPAAALARPPSEPPLEAPTRGQNLEALERAADSIRPSWHGTEAAAAKPLPAPAPLPVFEGYAFDERPQYSADSTVRTAAILPERLAQLLKQPGVANASRWLRARPLVLAGLGAGGLLLLFLLLWPASDEKPDARGQLALRAGSAERATPPPPPLPAQAPGSPSAPSAGATPAAEGASAAAAGPTPASEPVAPAPSAKRRDKRVVRAVKPNVAKPRALAKPNKVGAPAR